MNRANIHQRNTKRTTCDLNYSVMDRQYPVPHEFFTMEQNTVFPYNFSNVQVFHSITRFDSEHLSYALDHSNCNKLVKAYHLGPLADLLPLCDKYADADHYVITITHYM